MLRRLDGLDDAVRGNRAHGQRGSDSVDRLMVGAVHADLSMLHDPPQQAPRGHLDRVRQAGGGTRRPVRERCGALRRGVLHEAASPRDLDRLHAPTDAPHGQTPIPGPARTFSAAAARSLSPGPQKKRPALPSLRWWGVITYVPRRVEPQTAFAARSLPRFKAYENPPMIPPNVA